MLQSTFDIMTAALKADSTITPAERTRLLEVLRRGPNARPEEPATPRLLRRAEVAKRLSCSIRTVDNLTRDGSLHKRSFPGRKRGAGIPEAEVNALVASFPA
jgi:hypothetical protein